MQYKIGIFEKIECLIKDAKKCFLKKLNIWLALINSGLSGKLPKRTIYIYKEVYFIFKSTTS